MDAVLGNRIASRLQDAAHVPHLVKPVLGIVPVSVAENYGGGVAARLLPGLARLEDWIPGSSRLSFPYSLTENSRRFKDSEEVSPWFGDADDLCHLDLHTSRFLDYVWILPNMAASPMVLKNSEHGRVHRRPDEFHF